MGEDAELLKFSYITVGSVQIQYNHFICTYI